MQSKLRLLLVHDPGHDAQKLESELRGAGLSLVVEPCAASDDLTVRVVQGTWDAILVWASGQAAVTARDRVRQAAPEGLPVVVVEPDDPSQLVGAVLEGALRALGDLQAREENFRRLVEDSPVSVSVFVEGRAVWVNPAFARLLGYDPEEAIGRNMDAFVAPEEVSILRARTRKRLQGEPVPDRYETIALRRGGHRFPVEVSVTRVRYGGSDAIQVLVRDITERRRVEELRRSEAPFQRLAELTDDALLVHDQGTIVEVNEAFEQLVGYPREELVGRNAEFLATEETWRRAMEAMAQGLEIPVELEGVRRDGSRFFGRYLGKTVNHLGRTLRVLIVRDLTEMRQAEENLRQAYEELERIEERKSNFLMNVSHELRTPLVAIQGYVELLLEKNATPEKQEKWLQTIHLSTKRLERIISNLLETSDLHVRKLIFDFQRVDLAPLIALAITTLGPLTHKKGQTVERHIPSDLPPVRADHQRLTSVLLNLLDNAVKFSPPGGRIVVSAEPLDDTVLLSVKDHGIGIPAQSQERIFDRFYQVDDSSTREHEGSGIGLSLVKEIVEAHGGRVWVESPRGQGATFYVSLPVGSDL